MFDIACASLIYLLGIVCVLTYVFNQESYSGTSTLNLEESRGESPEPFTKNLASLFSYTLCVLVYINSF